MSKIYGKLKETETGKKIAGSQRYRIVFFATVSLIVNILFAVGNFALGLYERSYWFVTSGAYYAILSIMRFSAVLFEKKNKQDYTEELFIQRFSGIMLMGLSLVLADSVYLSFSYDVVRKIHEIIVITMAAYTFTKITVAVINFFKIKKLNSPLLTTLKSISFADAAVSIMSLQRLMLVSFEGMAQKDIRLMNTLTGAGVCLTVAVIGAVMIIKAKKEN